MPKIANQNRAIILAVTTALATTALSGCTTKAAPRADFSANKAQTALAKGKQSEAVTHAEAAVLAEPRNSAYRAMLGATYMEAGRFQSAATSFKDAMSLGDNSPRTALSYALAEVAAGNNSAALAVLNDWRDDIDAADLGLALSLAGEPDRGVHVLGNALRGGQATPKVRQNLAYSYALQGNWRAARLMAAEDVPANQIDDRIGQWAQTAAPGAHHARVAKLLDVPVIGDTGQPAMLALANHPSSQQLASEAAAFIPQAERTAQPVVADASQYALPPMGETYAGGELAPVASGAAPAVQPVAAPSVAPAADPVTAVAAYADAPVAQPKAFEDAFVAPAPTGATVAQVAQSAVKFVSNPVVQKIPARFGAQPKAARTASAGSRKAVAGEHLIQLGSFASEAGARRAWGIYAKRYAQLDKYNMVITKARVRGKTYFRVSAGGLQRASAKSLCSSVKAKGQGCITWAANAPLPGAVDRGVRMASR